MSRLFKSTDSQFSQIKNQIDNFFHSLKSIAIVKDYNVFSNMYSHEKIGYKVPKFNIENYISNYKRILMNKEYTILLNDESMITMNYNFDSNGNVLSHNLSFVPSIPEDVFIAEETDLSFEEKIILHKVVTKYVRIDYEPNIAKPILHSNVHFHFGIYQRDKDSIIKNLRVTFQGIVFPYDFMYIIFKYFYNVDDNYLTNIYDQDVKRSTTIDSEEEDKLILTFKRNSY